MNANDPSKTLILLVEDNIAHATLTMRCLSSHGFVDKIEHVSDGEAALTYLDDAKSSKKPLPSLILLDLRLPKVDGLSVLVQIKKDDTLRAIPVVILTTSEAEKDIARAYDHYVNSYLVKPIDFDQFNSLLESLSHYWVHWNKKPN